MRLERIEIVNFRNIQTASLDFSSRINCFVGENGSGKTNILDAIYYSSMCKSLTGSTDGQCINFGCDYFMIDTSFIKESNQSIDKIVCSFQKSGGKIIKRNDKKYSRLSAHIGVVPTILVSPYDSALINDAADERRRFLNLLISQLDPQYLNALIKYNSLLSERNKLLRIECDEYSGELFEVIDMQLCDVGDSIHQKRRQFISSLSEATAAAYQSISDGSEEVSLSYRSALNSESLQEILKNNFAKDRALGYTYGGVHRDDLVIKINDNPIKRFGSWGQQKSLLTALKLSEFDLILNNIGVKPILLLDDIFDKLDAKRVESLLKLVSSSKYGQIFITDSNKARVDQLLESIGGDFKLFEVKNGAVTSSNNL